MFKKHICLVLLAVMGVVSNSTAVGAQDGGDSITSTNGKINNYCLGGGDDKKVIPFDGVIHNPFKQTSHFNCEAEGGRTTFMPDLEPPIKDGKLA